jgi:hypothetical protein
MGWSSTCEPTGSAGGTTLAQPSRVDPELELAAVDQVGHYDVDQSVLAADGTAGLARSAAPAACPGWRLLASERTTLTEFL